MPPRQLQDGSKSAQDGPKVQSGFMMAQDGPKMTKVAPRWPKTMPRWLKTRQEQNSSAITKRIELRRTRLGGSWDLEAPEGVLKVSWGRLLGTSQRCLGPPCAVLNCLEASWRPLERLRMSWRFVGLLDRMGSSWGASRGVLHPSASPSWPPKASLKHQKQTKINRLM